uniref:Uncharacterized protein n=1 Tax=Tetradesmus obliquus TaxID=3088 RepID=A0A383VAU8_TETOB
MCFPFFDHTGSAVTHKDNPYVMGQSLAGIRPQGMASIWHSNCQATCCCWCTEGTPRQSRNSGAQAQLHRPSC